MTLYHHLSTLLNIDKAMVKAVCNVNCPAAIEAKYNLIGDMDKFCRLGCSVGYIARVACMDEYLEREVRKNGQTEKYVLPHCARVLR